MEDLKTNLEIQNEAAEWTSGAKAELDADKSRKKTLLTSFLEPWTLAVSIGELIICELRWREVSPNRDARLRRLQVAHLNNLLDWPDPQMKIIRIRPENIFDPPARASMLETLGRVLGTHVSIGDVMKIEGGWAVVISKVGDIPASIPGFTIRALTSEEISELPKSTQTGPKEVQVPSPRIDAVAGKVLKPSREQIKKHVDSGGVLLNYSQAKKPGIELVPSDIVAVRGGGRFRFDGILGETKKGRVTVAAEILNGP